MANTKEQESDVVHEQFRRNLSSILIDKTIVGPEITVGETVLRFRSKAPVKALAKLIGSENRIDGMAGYIRETLVKGQEEAFDLLMDDIDLDGLAEIINALGEGYTSFPEKS